MVDVASPGREAMVRRQPSVERAIRLGGQVVRPLVVQEAHGQHRPMAAISLEAIPIDKPEDTNVLVGQAHFIKTVEDLHEALATAGPHLRFGLAFCEASGPCLVRRSGNDDALIALAADDALAIGAGHSFVALLRGAFPVAVLNSLKLVPEVCTVFCATANPVDVLVAVTPRGRGVVGVVDGSPPVGIETPTDAAQRHALLRTIGYKL